MSDAKEQQREYRRHGITARKWGGDDSGSWAVFVNGKPFVTGLSRFEVGYYKRRALEQTKGAKR